MNKNTIFYLFYFLSVIVLAGCNTARKTMKSEMQSVTSTQTIIEDNSSFNQSEVITTQDNFNESLKGSFEFTRIDFTDGTTIENILPNQRESYSSFAILSKRTEPHDIKEKALPGVKAIVNGRIDFNKENNNQTTTQSQKEKNLQSYHNTQQDTTSEITHQEISNEKEKHGFFYFSGIFLTCIVGGLLIYYIHKFFTWLMPKIVKDK